MPQVTTFVDHTFTGETCEMDGRDFLRCTFRDCEIIYRGRLLRVDDCRFERCDYVFRDAASNTIAYLQKLWRQPEGRRVINDIIAKGAPPAPVPSCRERPDRHLAGRAATVTSGVYR